MGNTGFYGSVHMETCGKGKVQRCHHQLGSMPNCDGNDNDTDSFVFAAAQYERALIQLMLSYPSQSKGKLKLSMN